MAGADLVKSEDAKLWQAALASYDKAIEAHGKTGKRRNGLVKLDKHVRQTIPEAVESRRNEEVPNGYLTKEDICKIVEWKITRGKFRPLMRYANALSPELAQSTTKEALQQSVKDSSKAMTTLTGLKGIGPATASAILSLIDPSGNCPFLSDEAMHAFGLVNKAGKLDYTIGVWTELKDLCQAKAQRLNDIQEGSEPNWTAALVERALWAATTTQTTSEL